MSDGVNINISGGNVAIGSVSKGDNSHINSNASITDAVACELVSSTYREIAECAKQHNIAADEVKIVVSKIEELKEEVLNKKKEIQVGKGILKFISDNYLWAYPMVKDLTKILWPSLLAMISV